MTKSTQIREQLIHKLNTKETNLRGLPQSKNADLLCRLDKEKKYVNPHNKPRKQPALSSPREVITLPDKAELARQK